MNTIHWLVLSKRWYLIAAYGLIWLAICLIWLAISAVSIVLYGVDITAERIFAVRLVLVLGGLISATLISILLHLYFHKLKLLEERDRLIAEIRNDLAQVKTLRSLLSVCSYCKKVRNNKGYWEKIEEYISNNSHTEFTHGVCPECLARLQMKIRSRKVAIIADYASK